MLIRRTQPHTSSDDIDGAMMRRLRDQVERLAMPRDVFAQPAANARARESVADELSSLGFEVSICGEWRNVVATPRGPHSGEVVAAHYDSVAFSPGADDNASAVAVMLEAAREAPDTAFIAFNAEERSLSGSRELVAEWVRRPWFDISRVQVLEMVGFTAETQRLPSFGPLLKLVGSIDRGDFIGLVSNDDTTLRRARAANVGPPLVTARALRGAAALLPDILRSDHAPFWAAGIAATMWTDTAEFRNPHYHQASDTVDTLDYEFMAQVVDLLGAVLGDEDH